MRKLKFLVVYFAVFSTAIFFSKCTFKEDLENLQSSLDSVQLYIGSPEFTTSLQVVFVDVKTNEIIIDKDIKVKVQGKDRQFIFNNIGSRQTEYTAFSGILDLVIDPHLNNSISTNPLSITLVGSVDGYTPVNENIEITEANRIRITIPLISLNNPPEGVTVISNKNIGSTDKNGTFLNTTKINFSPKQQTARSNNSEVVTGFEIPAGIKLFDYDGNPLIGIVDVQFWFNNFKNGFSETSLGAPGLSRLYAKLEMRLTVRNSAGTGYDNVGSMTGGEIKYIFRLPGDYLNPLTNAIVKEGDLFSRKSYIRGPKVYNDPIITEISTDTVKKSNDALFLQISTKAMALRWDQLLSDACNKGPVFRFVKDSTEKGSLFFYHSVLWKDITIKNNLEFSYSSIFSLGYLPIGQTTHIFKGNSNNSNDEFFWKFSPDSLVIDNSCVNKEYIIKATKHIKPDVEFVDIEVDFTVLSESNKQLAIKPNMRLYYSKSANISNFSNDVEMKNGKAVLTNVLISSLVYYKLSVSFGNEYYRGEMYCSKINGKYNIRFGLANFSTVEFHENAIIDGNTKKIKIKYNLTLSASVFNQIKI